MVLTESPGKLVSPTQVSSQHSELRWYLLSFWHLLTGHTEVELVFMVLAALGREPVPIGRFYSKCYEEPEQKSLGGKVPSAR